MTFPKTSRSLVQRLSEGGSEEDWRRFLEDYWGPVCRFALRWGAPNLADAEDVASQTFEVLWTKGLLARWSASGAAKLRTLLCGVVRNLLSNRYRVEAGRRRHVDELAARFKTLAQARDDEVDRFYATWVEDLVQRAVELLSAEYYCQGKGDYVRVLYGRLCQRQTLAEVAEALQIKPTAVDNYFRHARRRLAEKLEELVRRQTARYSPPDELEAEFALEWQQLGRHLAQYGGLEEAVRRAFDLLDPVRSGKCPGEGLTAALTRITSIIQRSPRHENPGRGLR